ncbi:MAG: T9SS type A sorting domain-containing protein [Bacteroidales bacterium]|nr:T9SS type A sorting domain-containing protein [Bacteroidales bacterium]
MKRILLIVLTHILIITSIFSQALPIGIDGKFEDWTNSTANYTDTQNDGGDYDMLSFSVSNDSAFLYITFALSEEIQLNYGNQLFLQIDTDNDAGTGYPVNGIGSELGIDFEDKKAYFTPESSTIIVYQNDIMLRALPTVTSDTFEIAIGRDVYPDGIHPLFTGNTIKLCFTDNDSGGDDMPNIGTTFTYVFDETDVGEYNYIDFEKNNNSDIRLMTYNILNDGLTDPDRVDAFQRIITTVNPDIITFNECWNTEWWEAKNLLNEWLPLPDNDTWECWKVDAGNITCSKYDITGNYTVLSGSRITASFIDLPNSYSGDILIINSHFACCDNNAQRQEEADAIISFLKDVKSTGGAITLPYGTPFVISGDLNLVGYSQQLTTLLTGDIVDNATFGEDQAPDWDDTDLNDIISFQTDLRMAYTWENNYSSYWPGRLDFAICSDVGTSVSKAFTINTSVMSSERLLQYNLLQSDTYTASDHFPKVTDFIIEDGVPVNSAKSNNYRIFPVPSDNGFYTVDNLSSLKIKQISVISITGQLLFSEENTQDNRFKLDLSKYNKGVYIISLKTDAGETSLKIIR